MRRFPAISIALLLTTTQACSHAQTPAPAPWLLGFDGKSTNELVLDKHFPEFLRTHVMTRTVNYWIGKPTSPAKDALEFLHGPPDDVHVADGRYLTASACVPHDCPDRGLLWVDVTTGATVFAASVYATPTPILGNRAHLWMFSNVALQAATLPPTLTDAVARWSGGPNGDDTHTVITDVTLVQPNGKQMKLTPADVHAWAPATSTTKAAGK